MTRRKSETPNPLTDIEKKHRFTFGTPTHHDDAGGSPSAALACPNPVCKQHNRHVQIHDDTVLPVHCGACGQELLPDPNRPKTDLSVGPGPHTLDALADLVAEKLKNRP